MYIDPPYNNFWSKLPNASLFSGGAALIRKAFERGIATDPDLINWTDGKGSGKEHDPWSYYNYGNNKQKLEALRRVIENRLQGDCNGNCSSRAIPLNVSLKIPPRITKTLSSNLSSSSFSPGESVTIFGSGFSSTGNSVALQNTKNPNIYYDIPFFEKLDLNQGQLSFVLPASPVTQENTTPGEYILRVSAVDSDWSNTIPITIIASLSPATTPNLTVSSLSATGSSAGAGILYAGEMSVRATIVNRGGTTATTFRNIFQYRDVTNGGAWTDWVRFEVSGLAEGAR